MWDYVPVRCEHVYVCAFSLLPCASPVALCLGEWVAVNAAAHLSGWWPALHPNGGAVFILGTKQWVCMGGAPQTHLFGAQLLDPA